VTAELLWDIYSRLRAGESHRAIATTLGLDKKTVNQYVARIAELSLGDGLDYIAMLERLSTLIPRNKKPKPATGVFEPLEDEIRSLIAGSRDQHREGMKAKTAWEVISRRHELVGKTSYESFKRFIRNRGLSALTQSPVVRLETEPGKEVQIDYGKVGTRSIGNDAAPFRPSARLYPVRDCRTSDLGWGRTRSPSPNRWRRCSRSTAASPSGSISTT